MVTPPASADEEPPAHGEGSEGATAAAATEMLETAADMTTTLVEGKSTLVVAAIANDETATKEEADHVDLDPTTKEDTRPTPRKLNMKLRFAKDKN